MLPLPAGGPVETIALAGAGLALDVNTYGAIITSLRVPDRNGTPGDVVLGHDDPAGYRASSPYFGAVVGRYANRIARGRFSLGGREYRLAVNNGNHALHGGMRGFDKVTWRPEPVSGGVRLRYTSPAGEEGYPGTLDAAVTYAITAPATLRIDYEATTDAPTPVNLTQHTYFNLGGGPDILDHELVIHAARYTPVDATLIPTGELAPVAGTPFDFRTPHRIGERIASRDPQLLIAGGYDHNFVLDRAHEGLVPAARVRDPDSGRTLVVETTEPGVQFYSGNFLDGSITGKGGRVYGHRSGFCLETQHFPDSPNQPAFPSTILEPGHILRSSTTWTFGTDSGDAHS